MNTVPQTAAQTKCFELAKVHISKAGDTQDRIIYSYEIMYENE